MRGESLSVQNKLDDKKNLDIIKKKFDWKFYTSYYEKLNEIKTETMAWYHFKNWGYKEGRLYCRSQIENTKKVLIVMPTYNSSSLIEGVIHMIEKQTYTNWNFLIIDDGSDDINKSIFNKLKKIYSTNNKIIFMENEKNIYIGATLNKGINYLLENNFHYFTWISDNNEYYPNFLEKLVKNNLFFNYSSYKVLNKNQPNNLIMNNFKYLDKNDLLTNFKGCASFMWTKDAIKQIGFYNEETSGKEDYEYLLKTFEQNEKLCNHIDEYLMTYRNYKYQNHTLKSKSQEFYDFSIVFAYCNRREQTITTLDGFEEKYANKYNFEVIIVDDNSNNENKLQDIIEDYSFPINLIVISEEEKGDRVNPCTAYNKGFKQAKGEIVIIQKPECYHVEDILGYANKKLLEKDYFSYSCYSANSFEITNELLRNENPYELIQNNEFNQKNFNIIDLSWYNHPTEPGRNVGYHFCSAIYKSKLDLLGGFDERFADGHCFDDDEFLLSIKHNLQLDIEIVHPDNGFVIHQYHNRNDSFNIEQEEDDHPIKKKWLKNKKLFEEMKKYHEEKQFHFPKLLHLYWDGSPLSFLNLITVLSFNEYHKFWKINVFMPNKRKEIITWKTFEQKEKYTGKDYFNELLSIPNVFIHKIDLEKIGFYNDASEVIKSDYFRYYILEKHGGLWSDFDIIYTACVEDKMNFKKETIIFKCVWYSDSKNKINTMHTYFPVCLFLCKRNNTFFKNILIVCLEKYDKDQYQCIGTLMWNNLFLCNDKKTHAFDDSIIICNEDYYLPFAWNELDELFIKENNSLPKNNIGIHWFNGASYSKKYANELDFSRMNNFKPITFIDKFIRKYIKNII